MGLSALPREPRETNSKNNFLFFSYLEMKTFLAFFLFYLFLLFGECSVEDLKQFDHHSLSLHSLDIFCVYERERECPDVRVKECLCVRLYKRES